MIADDKGETREREEKNILSVVKLRLINSNIPVRGTRMEMNSIAAHNRFSNENIIILFCFVGAVIELVSVFILKSCDSFVFVAKRIEADLCA